MSSSQGRSGHRKRADSIVFDLMLLDGPPWGFTLGDGRDEQASNLVVTDIELASPTGRKIRLLCGDEVVAINDAPVSSLGKANELLQSSSGNLLVTIRRKQAPSSRNSYHEKTGNRSSFSVSDPCRHSMRSTSGLIETSQGGRKAEVGEGKVLRRLSRTMTYQGITPTPGDSSGSPAPFQVQQMQPEERRKSITRDQLPVSPGIPLAAAKRVTVKSVNVPGSDATTQDTYSTYLSSQQPQPHRESFRSRQGSAARSYETDIRFQSRSFSSLTNVGRDCGAADRYEHWKEGPNPDVEHTSNMNVASAKAMFEEISKSQENLLNIGLPQKPRADPRRATLDPQRRYPNALSSSSGFLSQSQPHLDERIAQGDGSRRSLATPPPPPRYSRSKLLSSFREKRRSQPIEIFEQFNASQSVEDLRQLHKTANQGSQSARPSGQEFVTPWLPREKPASQMREAAKKYHQQVGQKHPAAYRYSVGGDSSDQHARTTRSASLGMGSLGLGRLDGPEVATKPRLGSSLTKASSSSSLSDKGSFEEGSESDVFVSPGYDLRHQQQHESIGGETLISKLMREQQLCAPSASLIRIDEEQRQNKLTNGNAITTSASDAAVSSPSVFMSPTTVTMPTTNRTNELTDNPRRGSTQASPSADASHSDDNGFCIDGNDRGDIYHAKQASTDSMDELENIRDAGTSRHETSDDAANWASMDDDLDDLPPPPDELLIDTPVVAEKKPTRTINRRKRDAHTGQSRSSSCVSTDSTTSTATSDSGIVYHSTDSSPCTSPLTDYRSRYDSDYPKNDDDDCDVDEAFGGSREMLDDCGGDDESRQLDDMSDDMKKDGFVRAHSMSDTPLSSSPSSRRSSAYFSPKLEALDSEKSKLVSSMHDKIRELKEQEREIADEIKTNDDLGEKVRAMVERCAKQPEYAKYELFIGELNKIVVLLLSLTQRLHRYELMLQDLDMAEEEDKQKRDMLISKIEKLRGQHEEACYLRDVNDKRGENVAIFLEKYCNEEDFADFQYFIDMKSQLALMQSEIKEKVKLGEERLKALESAALEWSEADNDNEPC